VISAQLKSGGGWKMTAIPTAGGSERSILTIATGFGCAIAPSGHWLAYDSNDAGTRETYVVTFRGSAGRKWQVSTAGGFGPRWAGTHLYYYNERALMRTEIAANDSTISIGSEETLFNISDLQDFDVTRDEKKILLLQTLDEANRTPLSVVINWTQKLPATK
jgi:hypothetical protein